jgi:hypothetical protein
MLGMSPEITAARRFHRRLSAAFSLRPFLVPAAVVVDEERLGSTRRRHSGIAAAIISQRKRSIPQDVRAVPHSP